MYTCTQTQTCIPDVIQAYLSLLLLKYAIQDFRIHSVTSHLLCIVWVKFTKLERPFMSEAVPSIRICALVLIAKEDLVWWLYYFAFLNKKLCIYINIYIYVYKPTVTIIRRLTTTVRPPAIVLRQWFSKKRLLIIFTHS